MGFPKSLKMIEIQQQVRFGFTPDFVAGLCKWSVVKDYAWILHDKDHDNSDNFHIHCLLRFKDSVPTSAILAKIKGVADVQHLERIKGGWKSALAYLIHLNAPDKFQYDESEVHSNYDWSVEAKEAVKPKMRLEQIIKSISDGTIKRYNKDEYITIDEWVKYEKKIESAFRYQDELLMHRKDRNMEVFYICGDAGTGKTTLAKKFCNDRFSTFFISGGGSDFLDGYNGEPAIILDDFRGSQASLQTILKLLDNNTASSVPSRYRNKSISECKLIIITTVLEPRQLFANAFSETLEPYEQFIRRIGTYIVLKPDTMTLYRYSQVARGFEYIATMPNAVLDELKQFRSVENKKEYAKRLFGGLSEFSSAMVKAIDEQIEGFSPADDIQF